SSSSKTAALVSDDTRRSDVCVFVCVQCCLHTLKLAPLCCASASASGAVAPSEHASVAAAAHGLRTLCGLILAPSPAARSFGPWLVAGPELRHPLLLAMLRALPPVLRQPQEQEQQEQEQQEQEQEQEQGGVRRRRLDVPWFAEALQCLFASVRGTG